jgi:hypothetical protein
MDLGGGLTLEVISTSTNVLIRNFNNETIFPRISLPNLFLQWQSEARMRSFETMMTKGAQAVHVQPVHLPVMATMGEGNFPNLSTRGIGIVPKIEFLESFTQLFEETKIDTADLSIEESLPKRVEIIQQFYSDVNNFDASMMGGLDIFEGTTATNLKETGMAALLYTGEAPKYPSYQINCVVQIVEEGNQYYQFLLAARELFAMDAFHIHQIHYPFGYLVFPVEIKDKTPFPKRDT